MVKINGVVGCGRHNNMLHVLIDEDCDVLETKKRIAEKLGRNSFTCDVVSKTIKHLMYPGAQITLPKPNGSESYATLGGFLTVDNKDQSTKLYAVTAGHVSQNSEGKMTSKDRVLGQYLGEWKSNEDPDICVAEIHPDHIDNCDRKLRDSLGNPKHCVLLDLGSENGCGMGPELLHINGASSGISFGEIQTDNFHWTLQAGDYMLLKDRKTRFEQSTFCKPGDSGAIVCSNDRSGNFVNVLGTIIGKFESREESYTGNRYLALHIQSGLNHLKQKHKLQFKLCEQYIE